MQFDMKKIVLIVLLLSWLFVGCNKEDGSTDIMTVASEKRICLAESKVSCYLVKTSNVEGWTTMMSSIKGFDYTPGYEYIIEVKRLVRENPPQDWLGEYQLVKLISKVQRNSEGLPPQFEWPQ